jgi:hypothetical protein
MQFANAGKSNMNKLASSVHTTNKIAFSLFVLISGLLFLPFPSAARVGRAEKHYTNCAQLQKHLNDNNKDEFKGFEKAKMMRQTYVENRYMVYCNGGVIIDRKEKTVCRGYIGYSYAPKDGISVYYADWGWTNGSPNDADSGEERYCQKLR